MNGIWMEYGFAVEEAWIRVVSMGDDGMAYNTEVRMGWDGRCEIWDGGGQVVLFSSLTVTY